MSAFNCRRTLCPVIKISAAKEGRRKDLVTAIGPAIRVSVEGKMLPGSRRMRACFAAQDLRVLKNLGSRALRV